MKRKTQRGGATCSVHDAAEILGCRPATIRAKMQSGAWDLGEVSANEERRSFRIEKTKVMKMAGLTEWPQTSGERTLTRQAARAAERMAATNGREATARAAAILAEAGVITQRERQAMEAVIREG